MVRPFFVALFDNLKGFHSRDKQRIIQIVAFGFGGGGDADHVGTVALEKGKTGVHVLIGPFDLIDVPVAPVGTDRGGTRRQFIIGIEAARDNLPDVVIQRDGEAEGDHRAIKVLGCATNKNKRSEILAWP